MKRLLAACCLATVLAACDQAPPAKPAPAPSPAAAASLADQYSAAFARIGKDQAPLLGGVTFESNGLAFDTRAGGTLEQAFAAAKSKQDVVADLMKVAATREGSFGLPRVAEPTPQLLEFTGSMRGALRLLRADAARLWTEGDIDGAVARVEAMYGMTAHGAEDQIVLIALVNAAVLDAANRVATSMASGAGGKSLNQAQKDRLLAAIGRLHSADPAGILRARNAENVTDAKLIESLQSAETQSKQGLIRVKNALRGE